MKLFGWVRLNVEAWVKVLSERKYHDWLGTRTFIVNGNYSSKPVAPISQPAAKIEQDTIAAGGVLLCSRRTRLTYRGLLYMLITSIIAPLTMEL